MNRILIQEEDFDISSEIKTARSGDSGVGAVVSFVGTVRDLTDAKIAKMTLEHYPGMTQKALESIAVEAGERFNIGNTTIIHRVGEMSVSDQIVLVITTSKHRKEAFQSCEFIMDYLKTKAPFWKKEESISGESHWVEENKKDLDSFGKWNSK